VEKVSIDYVTPPGMPLRMGEITWDDSYARNEWGWTPQYATIDKLVFDFIKELKDNPNRYGQA
jgi:nucleoside-diphosphate-sugar epimerase